MYLWLAHELYFFITFLTSVQVKHVHSCMNVGLIGEELNDKFSELLNGTYTEFSLLEIGFRVVSAFVKSRELHQLKHCQLLKDPVVVS